MSMALAQIKKNCLSTGHLILISTTVLVYQSMLNFNDKQMPWLKNIQI